MIKHLNLITWREFLASLVDADVELKPPQEHNSHQIKGWYLLRDNNGRPLWHALPKDFDGRDDAYLAQSVNPNLLMRILRGLRLEQPDVLPEWSLFGATKS